MTAILWICLVALALLIAAGVVGHQFLLQRRLACQEALSAVHDGLKSRYAVVPNLRDLAAERAAHEKQVLQQVSAAREGAGEASGIDDQIQAERNLARALQRLLGLADLYPGLRNSAEFHRVRGELVEAERRIDQAIEEYNRAVQIYNYTRRMRGLNLLARVLGMKDMEPFAADITATGSPG
jgi:LemA protein